MPGQSPPLASGHQGEGDAPSIEPGATNIQQPSSPAPSTKQSSSPYGDKDKKEVCSELVGGCWVAGIYLWMCLKWASLVSSVE